MNLAEYQAQLSAAIRFSDSPRNLISHVVGGGSLTAEGGIDVYRRMVWSRLVEAHFNLLPRTAALLGARRFTQEVCEHLTNAPSKSFALEHLALPFAKYLARDTVSPVVREVALLEASLVQALISPNPRQNMLCAADAAKLRGDMTLCLHPSFVPLVLAEQSLERYRATNPNAEVTDDGLLASTSLPYQLDDTPQGIIVFRSKFSPVFAHAPASECRALQQLRGPFDAAYFVNLLAGTLHSPEVAFDRLGFYIHNELLLKDEG